MCSPPLVIYEGQTDTIMRIYYFTPTGMTKNDNNKCWQGCVEIRIFKKKKKKLEFSHIIGGNVKCYSHSGKVVSSDINHALTII